MLKQPTLTPIVYSPTNPGRGVSGLAYGAKDATATATADSDGRLRIRYQLRAEPNDFGGRSGNVLPLRPAKPRSCLHFCDCIDPTKTPTSITATTTTTTPTSASIPHWQQDKKPYAATASVSGKCRPTIPLGPPGRKQMHTFQHLERTDNKQNIRRACGSLLISRIISIASASTAV